MPKITEKQLNGYLEKAGKRLSGICKKVDVRDVFDENDNQLWYNIKGFPGYQISTKGYIRSFKKKHKSPYGSILTGRKTSNGLVYNLTDKNNFIRTVGIKEIESIVRGDKNKEPYYTFDNLEYDSSLLSRNQRAFMSFTGVPDPNLPGDVVRKPKSTRVENGQYVPCEIPHFTVIPDEEEKIIIKPIRFEGE